MNIDMDVKIKIDDKWFKCRDYQTTAFKKFKYGSENTKEENENTFYYDQAGYKFSISRKNKIVRSLAQF